MAHMEVFDDARRRAAQCDALAESATDPFLAARFELTAMKWRDVATKAASLAVRLLRCRLDEDAMHRGYRRAQRAARKVRNARKRRRGYA